MVSGHVLSQLYRGLLFEVLAKQNPKQNKTKITNNPCPLAGVSLFFVGKLYKLLKASEELVSMLRLRTLTPCAPIAQPRFQLLLAEHQYSPGKTLPAVSPPCTSHLSPALPSQGPLSVAGLLATQAELSSDSSNRRLMVFIDPIHVLSWEGIHNLLQMLVRTKPASDSKGPPGRVMDGDLFLSHL